MRFRLTGDARSSRRLRGWSGASRCLMIPNHKEKSSVASWIWIGGWGRGVGDRRGQRLRQTRFPFQGPPQHEGESGQVCRIPQVMRRGPDLTYPKGSRSILSPAKELRATILLPHSGTQNGRMGIKNWWNDEFGRWGLRRKTRREKIKWLSTDVVDRQWTEKAVNQSNVRITKKGWWIVFIKGKKIRGPMGPIHIYSSISLV